MAKSKKVTEVDDDHDDEPNSNTADPVQRKKSSSSGLNYTAIVILAMFLLPVIFAGVIQIIDYLYPEAAKERIFRERVVKCYEAANPTKLSEIDKIIQKYKGREYALFSQLRNKYERIPECQ